MKRIAIIAVVVVLGLILGGITMFSNKVEYIQSVVQVEKEIVVSDFDNRVESLMASTSAEWNARHLRWAESQIHMKDIENAEKALKDLDAIENSY